MFARGIGRRFANMILKKADIDLNKRAGELTDEEIEEIKTIIASPRQFKIPDWYRRGDLLACAV